MNDGAWHHIAIVYDGAKGYLYVDGVLDISDTYAGGVLEYTSDNRLQIGKGTDGYIGEGLIDEVCIYNRALTQAEITDLYNNYGYTTTAYAGRVLVRKYCSPEPTWGTWGTEEAAESAGFPPHSTGFTIG